MFRQEKLRKEGRNSYATPTPVTDGKRVYAVFNDGGIAALTMAGKPAWVNRDVRYYSQHGLGGSPILYKDSLIMSFDGSSPGPDKLVGWQKPWEQSFLLVLDTNTGKERSRTGAGCRASRIPTPSIVTVDGSDELISSAGDVIQGFDPNTGRGVVGAPKGRESFLLLLSAPVWCSRRRVLATRVYAPLNSPRTAPIRRGRSSGS